MFLTVHATVGLFLGSQVANPWLAFVIGYVSHLLLDLMPHGDGHLINKETLPRAKYNWIMFFVSAADALIVMLIFNVLIGRGWLILTPGIVGGLLGAIAPDYLWGIYRITGLKFLQPLHEIHNWCHHLLDKQINPPFKYGAIIQLLFLSATILLIIYR